jgi:hypothetical protein
MHPSAVLCALVSCYFNLLWHLVVNDSKVPLNEDCFLCHRNVFRITRTCIGQVTRRIRKSLHHREQASSSFPVCSPHFALLYEPSHDVHLYSCTGQKATTDMSMMSMEAQYKHGCLGDHALPGGFVIACGRWWFVNICSIYIHRTNAKSGSRDLHVAVCSVGPPGTAGEGDFALHEGPMIIGHPWRTVRLASRQKEDAVERTCETTTTASSRLAT